MSLELKFQDAKGIVHRANPARDIAYFFPQLLTHLNKRCEKAEWAQLAPAIEGSGLSEDDLQHAAAVLGVFCRKALETNLKNPGEALEASGFGTVRPSAQHIIMIMLGQICLGAFWSGIRSSTPAGEEPNSITEVADRAQAALAQLGVI